MRDEKGIPHLEAKYQHWRPNAGRQPEDPFSDGTIRLIGLIWRMQRARNRQVIVSTHSAELFNDQGIAAEEVSLSRPHGSEGTKVERASETETIRLLLEGGMTTAEAVLPMTAPRDGSQLPLFD